MHANVELIFNATTSKDFTICYFISQSYLKYRCYSCPRNFLIFEKIQNIYIFEAGPWPVTSPHYMKKCIRNCNSTTESENMLDHFHNDEIDKKKYIFAIQVILTITTIASAILFLSVKLKFCKCLQFPIQRRQSQ